MADPNSPAVGQKARVLVDGANPEAGAEFGSATGAVTFSVPDVDGAVFSIAAHAGKRLDITIETRSDGGANVDITPRDHLKVELDTPQPK
jgi:hypothetical protein